MTNTIRALTAVSVLLLISGCGGSRLLMEKGRFAHTAASPDREHHVVYYEVSYTYMPDGRLLMKTYRVLRLGENAASYPGVISVEDGGDLTLLDCEARVTHAGGSTESFGKDDFYRFNLSTRQKITREDVKIVPIEENLSPGDLIESVSVHECVYPQSGIFFKLSDVGLPADSVSCSVEVAHDDSLSFITVNGTAPPRIHDSSAGKRYTFAWGPMKLPSQPRYPMERVNAGPMMLAARMPQTWKSLGDWYLGMVIQKLEAGPAVAEAAQQVTEGEHTPREKMDAIFDYCQHHIRYEQVYLEHGEHIPNSVDAIFERKYGDCKDYAALMYAMARTVGVPAELALCIRGRGVEFFPDVPVLQFNHAIVCLEDSGRMLWYDGTDRAGTPGITSFDLANAPALIVEQGGSHLATIDESPENKVSVTGTLSIRGSGLSGRLSVAFCRQYAVELCWLNQQTNVERMASLMALKLKTLLNGSAVVDSVAWHEGGGSFVITAACEFPNCITDLQGQTFISVGNLFPELLPEAVDAEDRGKVFYCPILSRGVVDLRLAGARLADSLDVRHPGGLMFAYDLPPGPFTGAARESFITELDSVVSRFNHLHTIRTMQAQ